MRISDERRSLLSMILTPVIRYFVRESLSIQTFYDITKSVFVSIAEEEMKAKGQKINVSTLSAATGITRREVDRIYKKQELPKVRTGMSVTSRVIGQWLHHPDFTTKAKRPRVLSHSTDSSEFEDLVFSVSRTLEVSTVLRDLDRIGAVERTAKGIKLVKEVDRANDEDQWRIELAAQDIDRLLLAVNENISQPHKTRNVHLHTEADNIYFSAVPRIRKWLNDEAKKHHRKVREYLSKHDADITPSKSNSDSGARVTYSSFSYTEDLGDQ